MTRPVLPRTSSRGSGFFFCGIRLLPVVTASDSPRNPNSSLVRMTRFLGEPAQVDHDAGARVQEAGHEVAVGGGVEAVGDHPREPEAPGEGGGVDVVARPGDGPRAEGQRVGLVARDLEAPVGAAQGGGVGEEVVGREDGLGPPQVRVRRHERPARRLRPVREGVDEGHHLVLDDGDAPAQVEAQVEGHLLVPRPAGVQPLPGVADALDQLALDEGMYVLVRPVDERGVAAAPVADRDEGVPDRGRVPGRQHAGAGEGLRPREAPGDVIVEQPPVERERRLEREDLLVGGAVEPAGPQVRHVVRKPSRSLRLNGAGSRRVDSAPSGTMGDDWRSGDRRGLRRGGLGGLRLGRLGPGRRELDRQPPRCG